MEDLILRMERAKVVKLERVRMLNEGNERPWEASKLKMEGPAFRWESESCAKDLNF